MNYKLLACFRVHLQDQVKDVRLSPRLTSAFRDANVLASVPASGSLRLVTHLDIDDAGIERVLSAFDSAMAAVD